MKIIPGLIVGLFGFSTLSNAERLEVAFDRLPKALDSGVINSSSEFRTLLELTSRLITFDGADIKGDIAKSWKISKNHTEFLFIIEKNRKFSDGSTITVDDVVNSIKRTVSAKFGLHYDVGNILSVEKLNDESLAIKLRESDPFFIQDISNPEFAIVSKEDQQAAVGGQTFKISSGPLYVGAKSEKALDLKRNKFYPSTNSSQYEEVSMKTIFRENRDKTFEYLLTKELDYFWGPNVNGEQHQDLVRAGYLHYPTRSSYTYWITFNLKSKIFADKKNRQAVQRIVFDDKIDISDRAPMLKNTDQLYHPMGQGRLSQDDIKAIYKNVPADNPLAGKTIRILTMGKAFYNQRVCNVLEKKSVTCKIVGFNDYNEYAKALKDTESYDAVIMNNDFSSEYLRKNLQVALNKNRPLILVAEEDTDFHAILEKSFKSIDLEEVAKLQKDLARMFLDRAYVAPLYYDTRVIYVKSGLDTSKWSTIESDFSVWKLQKLSKK